jgi:hypothetical protein
MNGALNPCHVIVGSKSVELRTVEERIQDADVDSVKSFGPRFHDIRAGNLEQGLPVKKHGMDGPGTDDLGQLLDRLSALLVVGEEFSESEEYLVVRGPTEPGHLGGVDRRVFEKDATNEVVSKCRRECRHGAPSEWPAMMVGRRMIVDKNA